MKKGEHKKFDKYCGLACIEYENKEWYVVYNFTMPLSLKEKGELGQCIGRGKTENEAMENAIKNMSENLRISTNKFNEIHDEISKIIGASCNMNEKIIFPLPSLEYDRSAEEMKFSDTEKTNANICIDKKHACVSWV